MSVTHAPNKKDISRLIDQNVDKLVKYFNDHQDMLAPLISKNGDPNFSYQLIDLTTNTALKSITNYYNDAVKKGNTPEEEWLVENTNY